MQVDGRGWGMVLMRTGWAVVFVWEGGQLCGRRGAE